MNKEALTPKQKRIMGLLYIGGKILTRLQTYGPLRGEMVATLYLRTPQTKENVTEHWGFLTRYGLIERVGVDTWIISAYGREFWDA